MSGDQVIRGVPARVIADEVERIALRDGVCHPSALVDAARPAGSALHTLFTWDDAAAAEAHRLEEARFAIRSIRVVRDKPIETKMPRFVSVTRTTPEGVAHGYVPTAQALSGPDRAQVLRDVAAQLRGLRDRHSTLSEFAPVWIAIETALDDATLEQVAA